jgi:hypothetical protein
MTKDEALKLALEALECLKRDFDADQFEWEISDVAITAIKQALAAPVQEPVAWVCYGAPGKRDIDFEEADINELPIGTNLYTTSPAEQRTWVGLTDEERDEICLGDESIARSIEARLRDKNGGNHES